MVLHHVCNDYPETRSYHLSFPMETHVFKTEAPLLVLATTEYQKRVPVTIGTSLTDRAVDSLGILDSANLTIPWKTVCCATQS